MPQFDEDVLQRFEKNPSTSTRAVVHSVSVGRCLVWNVVREQELHPFHRQMAQALLDPNDYLRRDQFVGWFVHQYTEKPDFSAMVFFMDDACFTRERIFNTTTAMFGQKQTLMLHLLTATTNNALWLTFGWAVLLTF
jgi:hypothetical protein